MYPRYDDSVVDDEFLCGVIEVISGNSVQVRTAEMQRAYEQLQIIIQQFYVIDCEGSRVTQEQLAIGMSCVVVRHGCGVRGEIIYFDEDGYSEVLLVDEGRTDFFDIFYLYRPNALCTAMPALCIECRLQGLDRLNFAGVEALVEEACEGDGLQGTIVYRRRGRQPYVITLLDRERRDIAALVVQRYNDEIGNAYDNGNIDEAFDEPIADGDNVNDGDGDDAER